MRAALVPVVLACGLLFGCALPAFQPLGPGPNMADDLSASGDASPLYEGALTVAGHFVTICEVVADEALFDNTATADSAYRLCKTLHDRVVVLALTDGEWFHAERIEALTALYRQNAGQTRGRVRSVIGAILTRDFGRGLKLVRKAAKAAALARDLASFDAQIEAGTLTTDAAIEKILKRFERNMERLDGLRSLF